MANQTLSSIINRLSTQKNKSANAIHVSPQLVEAAHGEVNEVLSKLGTSPQGLTETEAEERRQIHGLNEVAQETHHGWPWRLLITMRNPLVVLLAALATISFATGDMRAGTVMGLMVVLGVLLKFVQETRADAAAAKLKAMIKVTATVIRQGVGMEIPLKDLVPGDIVKLSAGDMIPADIRVISSKDLFIIQASLTGESLPVEKYDVRETRETITPTRVLEYLLPRNECGERDGHCCCRRYRKENVLRQHGSEPDGTTSRNKL